MGEMEHAERHARIQRGPYAIHAPSQIKPQTLENFREYTKNKIKEDPNHLKRSVWDYDVKAGKVNRTYIDDQDLFGFGKNPNAIYEDPYPDEPYRRDYHDIPEDEWKNFNPRRD